MTGKKTSDLSLSDLKTTSAELRWRDGRREEAENASLSLSVVLHAQHWLCVNGEALIFQCETL